MLKIAFYAFALILVYRFLTNLISYISAKRYKKQYFKWVKNPDEKFLLSKRAVSNLLKKARVEDCKVPTSQPIGFGKVAAFNADVLSNFPSLDEDIFAATVRMINEAVGVFWNNMISCINPLFWIEAILFMPRHLLEYLGLNETQLSFRISNILLTAIWWVLGAVFALAKNDILMFITKLFQ